MLARVSERHVMSVVSPRKEPPVRQGAGHLRPAVPLRPLRRRLRVAPVRLVPLGPRGLVWPGVAAPLAGRRVRVRPHRQGLL